MEALSRQIEQIRGISLTIGERLREEKRGEISRVKMLTQKGQLVLSEIQ